MNALLRIAREWTQLAAIAFCAFIVAYLIVDGARVRAAMRDREIEYAIRDFTNIAFTPRPIVIESFSPERDIVEFSIFNRKLGTPARIRATASPALRIERYTAQTDAQGVIFGYALDTSTSSSAIAPGTVAIGTFNVGPDDRFILTKLVLGIDIIEP